MPKRKNKSQNISNCDNRFRLHNVHVVSCADKTCEYVNDIFVELNKCQSSVSCTETTYIFLHYIRYT